MCSTKDPNRRRSGCPTVHCGSSRTLAVATGLLVLFVGEPLGVVVHAVVEVDGLPPAQLVPSLIGRYDRAVLGWPAVLGQLHRNRSDHPEHRIAQFSNAERGGAADVEHLTVGIAGEQ